MNHTDTRHFEDYRVYKIGLFLWQFGSPVLILVGTVGNVLSILVLLRPKLRQSTTMFYLMCLSVGDLFTLYTGLMRYWINTSFNEDIRKISSFSCKLHTFLVYFSLDFTVWILVSVTIDRCLSVSLPFKSKQICTLPKARVVVVIIVVALLLKNLHFFWTIDLVHTWEFRCDGNTPDRKHFLLFVWPYIDLATFCVIPFSIMIVANIKIIYEIVRSQRKIQSHSSKFREKYNETGNVTPRRQSQASEGSEHMIPTNDQPTSIRRSNNRVPSLTAMLLTVNCVFLVTTFPVQVFLIGDAYWFASKTDRVIAFSHFWWAIVNMLQYLNNAIHFFLYCLTGPKFRVELKVMLKRTNVFGQEHKPLKCEFYPLR